MFLRNIEIFPLHVFQTVCACAMPQSKKGLQGPHFKEDDCTLSVYLSLLVYLEYKIQRTQLSNRFCIKLHNIFLSDPLG